MGAVIEIPAITLAVWVLAQLGFGDPDADFMHVMRLTAVFAGPAAVITAGGIGRLAAYGSVDRRRGNKLGGRARAVLVAARAHAFASAGLVLIAAIPHGHLPGRHSLDWLAFPAGGLVVGAACGVVLGLACGGAAPVTIGDVMALARRPTDVLRHLLDPEDLVKLGSAVRDRTSHLFAALFERDERTPAKVEPPDDVNTAPERPAAKAVAEVTEDKST